MQAVIPPVGSMRVRGGSAGGSPGQGEAASAGFEGDALSEAD